MLAMSSAWPRRWAKARSASSGSSGAGRAIRVRPQANVRLVPLDLRLADHPALERAMARQDRYCQFSFGLRKRSRLGHPEALHAGGCINRFRRSAPDSRNGFAVDRPARTSGGDLACVDRGVGAEAVFWNRCYEPASMARDREVERRLRERRIAAESCGGKVLFEPGLF